jgi:hypothetical protein
LLLAFAFAFAIPRAALGWGGGGAAPPPVPPATAPAAPAPAPAPASPAPASLPAPTTAATDVEGPMRPEAAALFTRGLERFATRDYAAAVTDFEAGYAIDPRREFLFAEGQAKRLAGDCKGAVTLYQRFLASNPTGVQANATQMALGRCAQHLADHPEVVVVQQPRQPPPPPPPPIKWWRDPFGLGFAGAGVVGVGVGIGFIAASYVAQHDADSAPLYDGYAQRWATAESRWQVGVGTLALGAALAGIGVARFVVVRRQALDSASPIAVSVGPGRLQIGGAF